MADSSRNSAGSIGTAATRRQASTNMVVSASEARLQMPLQQQQQQAYFKSIEDSAVQK